MREEWSIFVRWYVAYAFVSHVIVITCGLSVDVLFEGIFYDKIFGGKHFITIMFGFLIVFLVRLTIFGGAKPSSAGLTSKRMGRLDHTMMGLWYASILLLPACVAALCYLAGLDNFIIGSVLMVNTLMLYVGSRDKVIATLHL